MARRAANFISAIFVSVIAAGMTAAHGAPAATDDCLSAPKGETPQGQHWYYRIDHATKRQCWYLREEAEKVTQSAAPHAASTSKPADSAPQRSLQDAHAEYRAPQPAADPDATASMTPSSAPAFAAAAPQALPQATGANDAAAQQPAVTARWPDVPATPAVVGAPPAPAAPAATVAAASPRPKPQATPASVAAPVTLATAEASTEKPSGSVRTLLLVAVGALAIAGLSGRFIYRFAGSRDVARQRAGQRRRVNWEPAVDSSGPAPWTVEPSNPAPRTETEFAPPHVREAEPAAGESEADLDLDEITEMLERLLRQGPKLDRPTAVAASADYERSRQDRSGVRA